MTSATKVTLRPDGVVHNIFFAGADIGIEDAQAAVAATAAITKGHQVPILVDMSLVRSVSRDARVHFSGPIAAAISLAVALLIRSPISRVIGNFMLGMNKSGYPVRLFTSEDEAFVWLQTFLPAGRAGKTD